MRTDELRTILFVDDDPDWRFVASQWLEPRYAVVGVGSGEELLGQLESYEPDLLVLDVGLPGPDGVTLCRRIRRHPRFGGLPVLVVTGETSDDAFARIVEAGGTVYLRKPVGRRRLVGEIEKLLEPWREYSA